MELNKSYSVTHNLNKNKGFFKKIILCVYYLTH